MLRLSPVFRVCALAGATKMAKKTKITEIRIFFPLSRSGVILDRQRCTQHIVVAGQDRNLNLCRHLC
jgi:hypothetical protein